MQTLILRNVNDPSEIGQRIRAIRESRGLSQDRLADRMGTNRNAVSRHEKGENDMSVGTFFQYAEALEISPQALAPDRFRQESAPEDVTSLDRILTRLSKGSLQMVRMLAEHLEKLESAAPAHS